MMESATWTGDFIADVFTDRLHSTEELSFNDPVPTKCSFGRGKRQEDIPIPRMPKVLLFQVREVSVKFESDKIILLNKILYSRIPQSFKLECY